MSVPSRHAARASDERIAVAGCVSTVCYTVGGRSLFIVCCDSGVFKVPTSGAFALWYHRLDSAYHMKVIFRSCAHAPGGLPCRGRVSRRSSGRGRNSDYTQGSCPCTARFNPSTFPPHQGSGCDAPRSAAISSSWQATHTSHRKPCLSCQQSSAFMGRKHRQQ